MYHTHVYVVIHGIVHSAESHMILHRAVGDSQYSLPASGYDRAVRVVHSSAFILNLKLLVPGTPSVDEWNKTTKEGCKDVIHNKDKRESPKHFNKLLRIQVQFGLGWSWDFKSGHLIASYGVMRRLGAKISLEIKANK